MAQVDDLLVYALTQQAGGAGNQWLGVPTAPTATGAASGAMAAGTYHYIVTFATIDASGSVIGDSGEGQQGLGTAVTISASQKVNLTGIPISPSPACNARRIWRINPDATQRFVATIADNTTTTYTDNNASPPFQAIPQTDTSDQSIYSSQNFLWREFWGQ